MIGTFLPLIDKIILDKFDKMKNIMMLKEEGNESITYAIVRCDEQFI